MHTGNVFFCSESVDQVVEKYGLQKITLLREISVKTGIQVNLISCPTRFVFKQLVLYSYCIFIVLPDTDKRVQFRQPPQARLHRGGHPEYFPCGEACEP